MSFHKSIRIVHVITTLSPGGAEAMLYKLLKQTYTQKHVEQQVVTLSGIDHYGPMLKNLGVTVYFLNLKQFPQNILQIIQLWQATRRFKPNVLMSWLYHADLFGVVMAKTSGIRRTIWNLRCSDMDLSKYNRLTKLIFRLLTRLSFIPDAIIANSTTGMAYHQKVGYRPKRVKIIPNGFDTDRFKPDHGKGEYFRKRNNIGENAPLIGMIARFDPMKDHALFFKVAGIVNRLLPSARFILVGKQMESKNPDIFKMMNESHLTEKILLMGVRSDLNDIYPALDLLVSTSAFGEGFPNVIGEAMSCGVPVVATDVGDSAYLLGDCGRIVQHGRATEMAQACIDLLSLPVEEKKRFGISARERIKTRFSIEQIGRRYMDLIADLILES